ncbi:S8 family serine peptidase [Botrimarina hoheduenensis]|uniref:Calcium-dependent protease n=1 Tax=Botrimarina hoheduenensis TaxID=2528000 RepID=A0A5C5WEG4_9BACT|nr:S8 family serine peptidase [Botrimarina hoheduenensis]TWT48461.1 Calcium-dependent protease precursor [Botrimarina hoheduenensis]
MRQSRRSHSKSPFRYFASKPATPLRKAPRRRSIETLEPRQMMATDPIGNLYFDNQWWLFANGQPTEFNPNSPTAAQTLAVPGEDINVQPAWQLATGAGTQVVIVSGAFQLDHPDLINQFRTAGFGDLDLVSLDPSDTSPGIGFDLSDYYGTALAGLIGAENNGGGVVGVAYGAEIVPVRLVPGTGDFDLPADVAAIVQSIRFNTGNILLDPNDPRLVPIDIDGDGVIDGKGIDPQNVSDVILHTGAWQLPNGPDGINPRQIVPLDPAIRQALQETATGGRAVWNDLDGDNVIDPEEVIALGTIHVVPAGNDGGRANANLAFDPVGSLASSQYDELANSRFTIAVGSIDFDGRIEDPNSGALRDYKEMGTNVLLVAPSGTRQVDITSGQELNSGLLTTDLTGANGNNGPAIGSFDPDGDFFTDTNYTSTFGGSEASAALVAGVIAQMLEVNPNLSYRDVQQILVLSSRQNDQFDESWVVNGLKVFQDTRTVPQYFYYDINTDDDPNTAEIENAILPDQNGTNDPALLFRNPNSIDFRLLSANQIDPVDISMEAVAEDDMMVPLNPNLVPNPNMMGAPPVPLYVFAPFSIRNLQAGGLQGTFGLLTPAITDRTPLVFENGAGSTVSWGYGAALEETGYAHGVLDAGLAVSMAAAWKANGNAERLGSETTVTTGIFGGTASFRLQPSVLAPLDTRTPDLYIPGGLSLEDLNTGYYNEYTKGIEVEVINDINDAPIGEVITNAPFYDPDGSRAAAGEFNSNRGGNTITLPFDPSIENGDLSIEWIEVRTTIQSGDIDHLRLTLVAPDGTQSELNAARKPVDNRLQINRNPQGVQGALSPSIEVIDNFVGPHLIPNSIPGSDIQNVGAVDSESAFVGGQAWTWTSNRHWGELFSADGGGWSLVVENYGFGEVLFGGQIEVSIHGTKATGNRIQGKIGIDDNKQDIAGLDLDSNFNFNRYVEFATLDIDLDRNDDADMDGTTDNDYSARLTFVLDDETDSVTYSDNRYVTEDPDTGTRFEYLVISMQDYELIDLGELSALDPLLPEQTAAIARVKALLDPLFTNAFFTADTSFVTDNPTTAIEENVRYRNFDYSQESFASGVTVVAEQYATYYDFAGNIVGTADAQTGKEQFFTTGSDGNYYFDVEATPEAPALPAGPLRGDFNADGRVNNGDLNLLLNNWGATSRPSGWVNGYDGSDGGVNNGELGDLLGGWGTVDLQFEDYFLWFDANKRIVNGVEVVPVFSYDISLTDYRGASQTSALNDRLYRSDYSGLVNGIDGEITATPAGTSASYRVNIIDEGFRAGDGRTIIKDVNFLLTPEPSSADIVGRVYVDANNNNVFDGSDFAVAGVDVAIEFDNGTGVQIATATTDANGVYSLRRTEVGGGEMQIVSIDLGDIPAAFEAFDPATGMQTVTLIADGTVNADFRLKIAGAAPGAGAIFSGVAYDDVNDNGVPDAGEARFAGIPIFLDADGDNLFDSGTETLAITDAAGAYTLIQTVNGSYSVRVDAGVPAIVNFENPLSGEYNGVAGSGQVLNNLNFALIDNVVFDYGSLNDPRFPVFFAQDGARHRANIGAPNPIRLGAGVTKEIDAQIPDAFDDGVTLVTTEIVSGGLIEFDILAFGQGASLNAWVDFNDDGDWDDAGEHLFVNRGLSSGTTTRIAAIVTAAVDTTATTLAARFRWGPFNIGYTGEAIAGEVEDYLLPRSTTSALALAGSSSGPLLSSALLGVDPLGFSLSTSTGSAITETVAPEDATDSALLLLSASGLAEIEDALLTVIADQPDEEGAVEEALADAGLWSDGVLAGRVARLQVARAGRR